VSSSYTEAYITALAAMAKLGRPHDLNGMAADQSKWIDPSLVIDDDVLRRHLEDAGLNDPLRSELRTSTARWDAAVGPAWAEGTPPNTSARRDVITRHLKLGEATATLLNEKCTVAGVLVPTVIAREWTQWYTDAVRTQRSYYWKNYEDYLATKKRWDSDARASLDVATDRVVERLTDPTQPAAYKAKGLVVGYVQSGKTANFTGVLAKAIDAGYRLVIVLTGTTDILRAQTQRRLDMELVGRENILAGIDEDDPLATDGLDYQGEHDWTARRFLEHGSLPRHAGRPNIHRLTTQRGDYKSLRQGIIALDFPRRDEGRPIYDPENLFSTDARLAVVKKNASVLTRLVTDLRRSAARIEDLPVLIVDDESDQASVNTSNPKKWQEDQKHRTAINRLIAQLLAMLPRAQYVGYTATPFANVFIDPSDAEDIFPNDFLISLPRTPGYMGPADFHDLDTTLAEQELDEENSNRKAHVRVIPADLPVDHHDLRDAMDAFLLAGAVKLYREAAGKGPFKHHTMLVHENMKTAVHRDQADRIQALWNASGYYSSTAHERLRELFDRDTLPVMRARGGDLPIPPDYAALAPYVAETVARVGRTGNPVLVVNSDKIEGEDLDFDHQSVWRILVGGNKLARGFTVEGLTVSYYRRLTKQGATLMQMGRWFGYRKGYRDLVRLYVTQELYTAFEAICRDEEYFRNQLKRYSEPVDGKPQITPAQVPPLVAQHLPWLKPDAPNKMYNARLTERRSPGIGVEPTAYPETPELLAANVETFRPLLDAINNHERTFRSSRTSEFRALCGIAPHRTVLDVLGSLTWADSDNFAPDLSWLRTLKDTSVADWAIIFPQLGQRSPRRRILGAESFSLHHRERRRPPYFGAISDPKHRPAADCIAGSPQQLGDREALSLYRPTRGAILVYPIIERDPVSGQPTDTIDARGVVMAFRITAPATAHDGDKRLVTFMTKDSRHASDAIVDLRM
jgi:hypothetical protein